MAQPGSSTPAYRTPVQEGALRDDNPLRQRCTDCMLTQAVPIPVPVPLPLPPPMTVEQARRAGQAIYDLFSDAADAIEEWWNRAHAPPVVPTPAPAPGVSTPSPAPPLLATPRDAQRAIIRGQGPRDITRIDAPDARYPHSQWEAHTGGRGSPALQQDGTWKHGPGRLSRDALGWLKEHGWNIP